MSDDKKNIRIVDIARLAGVSAGTVDRVLHNRGKVSQEKREKIERVLKEINYAPNIIARSLAMKKHYTILVFIPLFEKGSYWDTLDKGIRKAANELANFNIGIEYAYYDQYDADSFKKAASRILETDIDAVLIAPLFNAHSVWLSKKLDEKEIPYVYVDSNIEGQNNLAYFGANSFDSGRLAAKLLIYEIGLDSDIMIVRIPSVTTDESMQTITREKGFLEYLKENSYKGRIHKIELFHDLDKTKIHISEEVRRYNIKGGIMFNSRIYELSSVLSDDIKDEVKLVGYDLIEKNVEALKQEGVSFLLSQRSDMQGYNGVKALSNFLLFKKIPAKMNYMSIDIIVKENIEYYNNDSL